MIKHINLKPILITFTLIAILMLSNLSVGAINPAQTPKVNLEQGQEFILHLESGANFKAIMQRLTQLQNQGQLSNIKTGLSNQLIVTTQADISAELKNIPGVANVIIKNSAATLSKKELTQQITSKKTKKQSKNTSSIIYWLDVTEANNQIVIPLLDKLTILKSQGLIQNFKWEAALKAIRVEAEPGQQNTFQALPGVASVNKTPAVLNLSSSSPNQQPITQQSKVSNKTNNNPTGSISGKVTDDNNGNALANIEVCLESAWPGYNGPDIPAEACTTTAADGTYTLSQVAADYSHGIRFRDLNATYITEFFNNQPYPSYATWIQVTPNQAITGIDAALNTGGGTISGVVTDEAGNPLPNITVYIHNNISNYWQAFELTTTDANGAYQTLALIPGDYRLSFVDRANNIYLTSYYGSHTDIDAANNVTVTANQNTADINVSLIEGGYITGQITDEAGNPLPDIDIEVMRIDQGNGWWYDTYWVKTDANGNYQASRLKTGTYNLTFYNWYGNYMTEFYDNTTDPTAKTPVDVTAGQTTANINAALTKGGNVTGRVTDEAGNPLANIEVAVSSSTYFRSELESSQLSSSQLSSTQWSRSYTWVKTDANGYYDAGGLETGSYKINFRDIENSVYMAEYYNDVTDPNLASLVDITLGQTTSNIDAVLTEGGHIAGTVTNEAGNPLANITVIAFQPTNYGFASTGQTQTDAQGNYDIGGLTTGSHHIMFSDLYQNYIVNTYLDEYYDDKQTLQESTPVSVTLGQYTQGINATLTEGGHITGLIQDTDANPLARVLVQVWQEGIYGWEFVNANFTDETGHYDVGGLETGTYRLLAEAYFGVSQTPIRAYFDDAIDLAHGTNISVTESQTTPNINVTIFDTTGQITGRVTNAEGEAINGIQVEAMATNGSSQWLYLGAYTDINGEYTLDGVISGTYVVSFFPWIHGSDRYLPEYYDDVQFFNPQNATPITVMAQQSTDNIDAVLDRSGSISGIVNSETDGSPLTMVSVCAQSVEIAVGGDRIYNNWNTCTLTNQNGSYNLINLFPGNYVIQFEIYDGTHIGELYNNKHSLNEADLISIDIDQHITDINATLAVGGYISGQVTDEVSNTPLSSILICTSPINAGGWRQCEQTNTDGSYTISGLYGGDHVIEFWDGDGIYLNEYYNNQITWDTADPVNITPGQTTSNINAALTVGGHITGLVTDEAGNPLPNIAIEVHRNNTNGLEWAGWGYTDHNGQYDVGGLHSGQYRVRFIDYNWNKLYIDEYYDNVQDPNAANLVTVTAGQTTPNINASLAEGGHITGQVTTESGDPIQGIYIQVNHFTEPSWEYIRAAYTDENGNYDVNGLNTGDYLVQFIDYYRHENILYADEYYNNAPTQETATAVAVTVGQTTANIDAVLSEGGTITGTVTNASGLALPHIDVAVYQYTGTEWHGTGWGYTDINGNYTLEGLNTGTYRVSFMDWSGTYAYEYYNDVTDIETATDVNVTVGQNTPNINAVLDDPAQPLINVTSISARINYDLRTGVAEIAQPIDYPTDVTVTKNNACPSGQTDPELILFYNNTAYPMAETQSGNNQYQVTIPSTDLVDDTQMYLSGDCTGTLQQQLVGQFTFYTYDPSGIVTNGVTDEVIEGATVTLYNVPDWRAKTSVTDTDENTCQSNLSKDSNAPWSQRPPTDLGVIVDPNLNTIAPTINPLTTDSAGRFGWEVGSGCWYVKVTADGYQPYISALVGTPPAVTDLNISLAPEHKANRVHLPIVFK